MAFFKKNPNEVQYQGGKKHWADVIKNTGANDLLVWRQPEEDFNTNSTLIVMPGEEAIFVHRGKIEQPFGSGTYQLKTENYPFISRLINMKTNGISTFNCVVYFFRTAHSMEIYWGTDSPIQVRDAMLGIRTSIQARGAYKVQIENSSLLLNKLLGSNLNFLTQEGLYDYFASEFQQHIKSNIARCVNESGQEVLGICAQQDVLADKIGGILKRIVAEYGLKLTSFSIMAIDIPKNDPNRELLEQAFAEKGRLNILGDDWDKITSRDMLQEIIKKQKNASGLQSMAENIGVGMFAAGAVHDMANQFMNPAASKKKQEDENRRDRENMSDSFHCSSCGNLVNSSMKFCSQCGQPVVQQKVFCTQCGNQLNSEDRFCPKCGNQVK